MPFQHTWLIPDKVVLIEMSGDVTLDELKASAMQTLDVLTHASNTIHEIIDQTHMDSVATNLTDINRFTRPVTTHPMMGYIIVCGITHPMLRFIASVVGQLSGTSTHITATYADALTLLAHLDPSIASDLDQLK